MPKFFTSPDHITDHILTIDSQDVAHIWKVLRLTPGDVITVCDGRGFDYQARIQAIGDGAVRCEVLEKTPVAAEPAIQVTLYQGLPKAAKMDYIIQKTTELGIVRIVPCIMERCVVKLEDPKAEAKKTARWQKIAEEAAKQSGRGIIPTVSAPMRFSEAVHRMREDDICFVPYECEEQGVLRAVLTKQDNIRRVSFMVGPEGGFSLSETEALRAAGIPTVTLGPRILRTETAGEAVLAMVMYEIGDVNGGKENAENQ